MGVVTLILIGFTISKIGAVTPTGLQTPSFDGLKFRVMDYIPDFHIKPLDYFTEKRIVVLEQRANKADQRGDKFEQRLDKVEHRIDVYDEAFQKMEELLPNFLLLERNSKGELQIPDVFWHALRPMLQAESAVDKDYRKGSGKPKAAADWETFIQHNEAKMQAWQSERFAQDFERQLDAASKHGVLVPRAEVMKLIRQNLEELQPVVSDEVNSWFLRQEKRQSQANGNSMEKFKKMLSTAHLEALAYVNIQKSLMLSFQNVNHFSLKQGAVINPALTSPTYIFGTERAGIFKRSILRVVGYSLPLPPPPTEALTKWDEAGDCWCSPSKGSGYGVQLAVLMANDLYPEQVVVEHIPSKGTLDPGSAPKDMDILAKIEGVDAQNVVGELSEKLWPNVETVSGMDESWIRIGKWTYDAESEGNHVQIFPVNLDLKRLRVSTRQLIVRARTNYGADRTCIYRVRVHGSVA